MPGQAEKIRQRQLRFQRMQTDVAKAQSQAAAAVVRKLYAECLPLWPSCRRGGCRRHRCCIGNALLCLKRAWPLAPQAVQDAAVVAVRQGGPRRLPAATEMEQNYRRLPPTNFVL